MPTPNPCPICGLAHVHESGDGDVFSFHCKRCGRFKLSGTLKEVLLHMPEEEGQRISVAARQADVSGSPLLLTGESVVEIGQRPLPRRSLIEGADEVLLYLADLASSYFSRIWYSSSHDHTLLGFTTERGMQDAHHALVQLGYLQESGTEITIEGWERIEELQREQPNSRKAFMAMSFAKEMDAAWIEGFEPGIRDTKFFEPVRVQDIEHAGKIDNLIIAEIRTSGLLVADFTGHRPSVYYEAGFAGGLGIPVIWCCREDQIGDVHFDIRQYNHVVWTDPGDLREKLKNRILAVVPVATKG